MKFNLNKDIKKLFLHSFGFIVRCTNISDINILFSSLCYIFKSRSISAKVKTHMNTLESYIRHEYLNLATI